MISLPSKVFSVDFEYFTDLDLNPVPICMVALEVNSGELVLIDFGPEVDHYTTDITRTFPVSGTFSARQAELYDVVLEAQLAGIAAARPGGTIRDVESACNAVIEKHGMMRLRLHGACHLIGMEVHDVGSSRAKLVPGVNHLSVHQIRDTLTDGGHVLGRNLVIVLAPEQHRGDGQLAHPGIGIPVVAQGVGAGQGQQQILKTLGFGLQREIIEQGNPAGQPLGPAADAANGLGNTDYSYEILSQNRPASHTGDPVAILNQRCDQYQVSNPVPVTGGETGRHRSNAVGLRTFGQISGSELHRHIPQSTSHRVVNQVTGVV